MNFIVALCLSQLALIVHKWITMLVLNNLEQKHSLLFHHDGYFLYAHKLDHWKRFQNQNVISFLSSPSSIIVRPLYPLDLPTLLQKTQIHSFSNLPFNEYSLFSMIISHFLSSPSITNCSVLSRSFWPVYAHTYSDTDDPHGHLFFKTQGNILLFKFLVYRV